jgi:hypothetical protein
MAVERNGGKWKWKEMEKEMEMGKNGNGENWKEMAVNISPCHK